MKNPLADADARVQPRHLERSAYIYVRQSSPYQVEHNRESGRRQYGLADWAQKIGWLRERIRVVDDDQGQSSATPETRSGFSQLITAVGRGEVGIVIGLEMSRLARNSPDWANLMYLCRFTDTLVADESGVYDPARPNDRLVLGLRGQVSEIELDTTIHRMIEARWNKARRGEFMTVPAVGYELDDERQLVLTTDESVSTALRTIFEKFNELGSASQVQVFFRDNDLRFPVRRKELRSHPVIWVKPSRGRVLRVLHNPVYAGAYAFGRSQTVRKLDDSVPPKVVVRRTPRSEPPVLIKDHHAAYISFDEFLRNQERLRMNRTKNEQDSQGAPREGRALLQGLARCGECGRGMFVAYGGRRAGRVAGTLYYECRGEPREHGKRICQVVFGKKVEQEVVRVFLAAIEPAAVDAAGRAEEHLRLEDEDVERLRKLEVEKAEYEAQRAQRQYDAVDPENRVVARELERRWNAKLVELEDVRAKAAIRRAQQQPLTEDEIQKARQMAADLPRVWQATTTEDRDRKRLLRCVIDEVQLRTEDTRYRVRIVWKGGAISDCDVQRQPRGELRRTSEETVDLVRRLAAEFDDAQIARILNKQGRRGARGNPFTKEAVRCIRRKNDIPRPASQPAHDLREGPFTADQAAAELGVSMSTVHRWLQDGVLAGKQATVGAPWRIVLTEDIRRRLSSGDAPEGWVGLTEAARRLGLSKPHVVYLVKTGKLDAMRTTVGKRQCWRIDVSSTDCAAQSDLFDQVTSARGEES